MENIYICTTAMKRGDVRPFLVVTAKSAEEAQKKLPPPIPPETIWIIEPITPEQARQLIKDLRKALPNLE